MKRLTIVIAALFCLTLSAQAQVSKQVQNFLTQVKSATINLTPYQVHEFQHAAPVAYLTLMNASRQYANAHTLPIVTARKVVILALQKNQPLPEVDWIKCKPTQDQVDALIAQHGQCDMYDTATK